MAELQQHRRGKSRLRLGIEATFIGFDGNQAVMLQDLSATGAKLLLQRTIPISQGLLRWMEYEVFIEATWRRGFWCGTSFAEPVPEEWLLATRAAVPDLMNQSRERMLQRAREFVMGEAQPKGWQAGVLRPVAG